MPTNYELGLKAQNLVKEFYLKNDYKIVIENYQAYTTRKIGEVDLIFTKDYSKVDTHTKITNPNILVMVEVKMRSNDKFGKGLEQISKSKLKAMYSSYLHFITKHKEYSQFNVRIDVASIDMGKITIIPNCYDFS